MICVPLGGIYASVLNAPGCMDDSQIYEWTGLYEKLERFYKKIGGTIVVESAFDKDRYPFLVKSAQDERHAKTPKDVNFIR